MTSFKILTNRLPVKWQAELREALGNAAAPAPVTTAEKDEKSEAPEIVVTAESGQIVDELRRWIQQMNRRQQSNKKNTFPHQGISLTIQRQDGNHIVLTERNASIVRQFLGS
jgi:hypothetical protein